MDKIKVKISFADNSVINKKIWEDLCWAVKHADTNLFYRYGIHVIGPVLMNGISTSVIVDLEGNIPDNFSAGRHLRGISNALLSIDRDYYNLKVLGKRLLTYCVVDVDNGDYIMSKEIGNLDIEDFRILYKTLMADINSKCISKVLKMDGKTRSEFLLKDDLDSYWHNDSEIGKLYGIAKKIEKIIGE